MSQNVTRISGRERRVRRMTGKIFNSIHIDLARGIFEINGEEMKYVKDISLKSEGKNWFLEVSRDEYYTGTEGQKIME